MYDITAVFNVSFVYAVSVSMLYIFMCACVSVCLALCVCGWVCCILYMLCVRRSTSMLRCCIYCFVRICLVHVDVFNIFIGA